MHLSIAPAWFVLICFCFTECVKYVDPPESEVQKLYATGTWILSYSDSAHFDSVGVLHTFHWPATECEKQERISFANGITYHINLVCNQAIPGELTGWLTFNDNDSTIGYGLKTDSFLKIAKLVLVTADTLKLIQQTSFAAPNIPYGGFEEKTYSR